MANDRADGVPDRLRLTQRSPSTFPARPAAPPPGPVSPAAESPRNSRACATRFAATKVAPEPRWIRRRPSEKNQGGLLAVTRKAARRLIDRILPNRRWFNVLAPCHPTTQSPNARRAYHFRIRLLKDRLLPAGIRTNRCSVFRSAGGVRGRGMAEPDGASQVTAVATAVAVVAALSWAYPGQLNAQDTEEQDTEDLFTFRRNCYHTELLLPDTLSGQESVARRLQCLFISGDSAAVNQQDRRGETPLHWVAGAKTDRYQLDLVQELVVQRHADPTIRNAAGETSLHHAAAHTRDPMVIQLLLDAGAPLNARDASKGTPLHYAATNPEPRIAQALIDAQANLNTPDHLGCTPLDYATTSLVRQILQEVNGQPGGNCSESASTVVDSAPVQSTSPKGAPDPCSDWRFGSVEGLVGCPQVNAQDELGRSRLMWAAAYSSDQDLSKLLASSANVRAVDSLSRSALHYAARYSSKPAIITALSGAGAPINAKDYLGRTPLHYAAGYNEQSSVIESLIENGADFLARDAVGQTPLHMAAGYGDYSALKELYAENDTIQSTLQVAPDSFFLSINRTTPLIWAASHSRDPNFLDLLICIQARRSIGCTATDSDSTAYERFFELNPRSSRDRFRRGPLHRAAGHNSVDINRALIRLGFPVMAGDYGRWTPLHWAIRNSHELEFPMFASIVRVLANCAAYEANNSDVTSGQFLETVNDIEHLLTTSLGHERVDTPEVRDIKSNGYANAIGHHDVLLVGRTTPLGAHEQYGASHPSDVMGCNLAEDRTVVPNTVDGDLPVGSVCMRANTMTRVEVASLGKP